jgi:regulator of sirC expression with transglutaminase-like and TPR domain
MSARPGSESGGHFSGQDLFKRAVEKSQKNDLAGAVKDHDEGLKLDPKNGLACASRGSLSFNLGDSNGALDDFNKACDLMPDNPQFTFLRDKIKEAIDQGKTAAGH